MRTARIFGICISFACSIVFSSAFAQVYVKLEAEHYTTMYGVQTESTSDVGGGLNLGYIAANDWMTYAIELPASGIYKVSYRVASYVNGGRFKLQSPNGATIYDEVQFAATGNFQNWVTVETLVEFPAGVQGITIMAQGAGWNINWLSIESVAPDSSSSISSSSIASSSLISSSLSSSPLSSSSSSSSSPSSTSSSILSSSSSSNSSAPMSLKIEAENYVSMIGVGTQTTSDVGGGLNVAYIVPNDSMTYAVDLPQSGLYTVSYRVASKSSGGWFQLQSPDGLTVYDVVQFVATGGYQEWTTVETVVNLQAGEQEITIKALGADWNINWLTVSQKIEAENYASMYGVKTEPTADVDGGLNVGHILPNDWMTYAIELSEPGIYKVSYRVASLANGGWFRLQSPDGVTVYDEVQFPATDSHQNWITIDTLVNFPADVEEITIMALGASWNINWFTIESVSPGSSSSSSTSSDTSSSFTSSSLSSSSSSNSSSSSILSSISSSSVSSSSASTSSDAPTQVSQKIEAEHYTTMYGVQTEPTSDVGGGLNLGYIATSDWMTYAVDLPVPGIYKVSYRVASSVNGGKFKLQSPDGTTIYDEVQFAATGHFQNWTTVETLVDFPAGVQEITIMAQGAGWNINWLQIETAGATSSSSSSSSTASSQSSSSSAPTIYTITAASNNGGTISPAIQYVTAGPAMLEITVDEGYRLVSIEGCRGWLHQSRRGYSARAENCHVSVIFGLMESAPQNFSAVAGDRSAILEWDPVPGAYSYYVHYSSSPIDEDNFESVPYASTRTHPYVLWDLINEQTYFLMVVPHDQYGQKIAPASASITVTPYARQVISDRYRISDGDQGVIHDLETDLEWKRCSLGLVWDGSSCIGSPASVEIAQALSLFAPDSEGWRLPSIEELASLIYCSSGLPAFWSGGLEECGSSFHSPTVDQIAFPDVLQFYSQFYLSSSPSDGEVFFLQLADFGFGAIRSSLESASNYAKRVRLVRDVASTTSFTLSLKIGGEGSGSIANEAIAINCQSNCEITADRDQSVALTAVPEAGSFFLKWNGSCTHSSPVCEVEMSRSHEVNAVFMNSRYEILASDPSVARDLVTGLEWQRCAVGQTWDGETCVGYPANRSWTAVKEIKLPDGWRAPTLSELRELVYCSSALPVLWKNDTSKECSGSYSNPTIFHGAFPNFVSGTYWSTTSYGSTGGYAVNFYWGDSVLYTIGSPQNVILVRGIRPPEFELAIDLSGPGRGKIEIDSTGMECDEDCTSTISSLDNVTLTATPNSGSTFLMWTGACVGTDPVCTISHWHLTEEVGAVFLNDRFMIRGEEEDIVFDPLTELEWQRCPFGQVWSESSCEGTANPYNLAPWLPASPEGWRLPTINELRTLVLCTSGVPEYWHNRPPYGTSDLGTRCSGEYVSPTILQWVFPMTGLVSRIFVSGTESPIQGNAWVVSFENGQSFLRHPANINHIRLVREAASDNVTAIIEAPSTALVGTSITLSGGNSSASSGDIVAYRWSKLPETEVLGNESSYTVSDLTAGQHQFQLEVEDTLGQTATAQFSVQVGYPPVADAPSSLQGYPGEEVFVDGQTSNIEQGALSYQWFHNGQLLSENAWLEFNLLEPGTYSLEFVVTSELGFSDTRIVEIEILADMEGLLSCSVPQVSDDGGHIALYPENNIPWHGGNAGSVFEIQRAFNHARFRDPSVQHYLIMPDQSVWDSMNVQQKGLYLINAERVARGIKAYAGVDAAVIEVAQDYAEYIHTNNEIIGHYNDGQTPNQRLFSNPYIAAHVDEFIAKDESVFSQSSLSGEADENYAVVRAIYSWLYEDKDWFKDFGLETGLEWGHRDHLLQTGLSENHGEPYSEGVMGFGVATGLYYPGVTPPTRSGAVTVFNTVDQGSDWSDERLTTTDVTSALGCLPYTVDLPDDDPLVVDLERIAIMPSSMHLAVGQSADLSVIGFYQDGSQRDLTAAVQFAADAYSNVSISQGAVSALRAGSATILARIAGIESNRLYVTVGEPANTSGLIGTPAESIRPYVAANATATEFNPLAMAVFTGLVVDRYGVPMDGVRISNLYAPEYGSVETNNDGRFVLAGPAGQQTIVYEKDNHLVVQRTNIAASNTWASMELVTLLPRDTKSTYIDLQNGSSQVHQSSTITDEFGTRRATIVFNGITSATVRSADGSSRPLEQFYLSATEFETPSSMPGKLPPETAFTWASDLHVDGTHFTDHVHFNGSVVMFVDNFLGFPVGEIVPIGYFEHLASSWIASSNGVVVRLLDENNDGVVDGLDYTGDGIADDLNGNGSTADEVIGLQEGYSSGDTLWWGSFTHMSALDYNWGASDAEAPGPVKPEISGEDEKNKDCQKVGSFFKPYQQSFHEDIHIAGTDITLHYSSQRTAGYHHKLSIAVSGDEVPASLEKMFARLEIAGHVFEQEFNPAPNVETEFIWDGTHPDGTRAQGFVSGRISIGYEYRTLYLSAGNAATEGRALSTFPVAWATLSDVVTQVPGRETFTAWQQRGITVKNTFESQLAEGWSLSSVHEFDPRGSVYMGSGSLFDVATPSLILKTGQTFSHIEGDDGYYQAGGKNIDYTINNENVLVDLVTGLEWQNSQTPFRTSSKQAAINYCRDEALPRNTGWRLPTPKEAGYTIDKSGGSAGQMIHSITQASGIWNTNTFNSNQRQYAAICVRGATLDASTITGLVRNDTEEVVVDKNNGLMWQDNADNVNLTLDWESSINYCESLQHAGHDDWRLPNINEHLYALPNPTFQFKTTFPIDTLWTTTAPERNPYWSSTTNAQNDAQAWAIESAAFNSEKFNKNDDYHVRCVREDTTSARMPFRFNSKGKHTATIDMLSGVERNSMSYNDAGDLVTIVDQFGNTVRIERDHAGTPQRIVAPNGQVTSLSINAEGDLKQVIYEDGSRYQFNYREGGLQTEKIDPRGESFTRQYDSIGRVERVTDPEGGFWALFDERTGTGENRYGFTTAEGRLQQSIRRLLENSDVQTTKTTQTGGHYVETHSADGLVETSLAYGVTTRIDNVLDTQTLRPIPQQVRITTPGGLSNVTQLTKTYGENGADTSRYTLTTTSNGNTSTTHINGRTGVHSFTSAEGRTGTIYTDPQTLLTRRIQAPGLHDTHYDYDAQGRLTEARQAGRVVAYAYDNRGNLGEVTHADGRKTSYTYDLLDRMTRVTYPDGHSTRTIYDDNGNATKVIVPSHAEHDITYTGINLVQTETRPVQETTQYSYNRDRQLTQISLPSGDAINHIYQQGKLARTELPEGDIHYQYQQGDQLAEVEYGNEQASFSYDGMLLTQLSYQGQLNASIGFGYNADFRVNGVSYAGSNTSLSYDGDGLLTGINGYTITHAPDHGLPQEITLGQWSKSWQWNAFGEATSVNYRHGTQQRYGYELAYNPTGQIIQKVEHLPDGNSLTYNYTYDDRYRLTEVRKNNQVVEAYGYDSNGNRTLHTSVELNIINQTASYTSGDQLQASGNTTYLYDANGRLSSKLTAGENGLGLTTYVYSSEGRLLQVDTPAQAISYRHNALGNRVAKLINGVVTEQYLWQDLTTLLATYDGQGNLKQRFEYTLGHTPTSFTHNGERYFIQTDHLGSPRVITDSNGNIVKTVSYDSYGNIIEDSNLEFQIPFGFAGGLYDQDTKLVRFGYRDYDALTGRWTARDPIGFAGGDTNLYGYVVSNPINLIDPIGLWSVTVSFYAGGRGGTFTFGSKNGKNFVYGGAGVGAGWGASFDLLGDFPRPKHANPCDGIEAFVRGNLGGNITRGPFSLSASAWAGGYSGGEGGWQVWEGAKGPSWPKITKWGYSTTVSGTAQVGVAW